MPWQARVANVAGELDPITRLPAYREVRIKVPRQSGKTTLELVLEVDRSLYWGPLRTRRLRRPGPQQLPLQMGGAGHLPAHHTTALGARRAPPDRPGADHLHPDRVHCRDLRLGGVIGSRLLLGPRHHRRGVGARDTRLEGAFRPAMLTRPSAQLWICSTEGTDQSTYFNDKVSDGRAQVEDGHDRGVAYFEWSALDSDDPDDPDTWRRCMPAIGHTVSVETIQADKDAMDPADFARYYLNRRVPMGETVISSAHWLAARQPESYLIGTPCFAIDVTPERSWAAIGAAGWTPDRRIHIEVIDHRPGTDWVAGRLAELQRRWRPWPVVVDPGSPAGSLTQDLTTFGVLTDTITAREYGFACGQFYDAICTANPLVAHLDQPVLNERGRGRPQASTRRGLGVGPPSRAATSVHWSRSPWPATGWPRRATPHSASTDRKLPASSLRPRCPWSKRRESCPEPYSAATARSHRRPPPCTGCPARTSTTPAPPSRSPRWPGPCSCTGAWSSR